MTITASGVRAKLGQLERREVSLWDVREWVEVNSWNMHQYADEATQDLVWAVLLPMYESDYEESTLTDEQVRKFVLENL